MSFTVHELLCSEWSHGTGLAQPDEDDYGYVSQEASAFYNKLMEKYTSIPSEEPKFSKKSLLKSSAADLNNTKVCLENIIMCLYQFTIFTSCSDYGNGQYFTNIRDAMSTVWGIRCMQYFAN